MTPVLARRIRFSILLAMLSVLALYVGMHLFPGAAGARVHVLTGRPIAGIATDTVWLDRETRSVEEAPDEALALIGIRPGMIVADVGAGSGYMTIRLARLVGPSGRVYANDLQPAMLRIIDAKATAERLPNIVLVRGTETETNLPAGVVDLALLVDVYHELSHPQEMLQSIRRALKDEGRLVLVEYRKEDSRIPVIPTHRMSVADATAEVQAEGFAVERLVSALPSSTSSSFTDNGPPRIVRLWRFNQTILSHSRMKATIASAICGRLLHRVGTCAAFLSGGKRTDRPRVVSSLPSTQEGDSVSV